MNTSSIQRGTSLEKKWHRIEKDFKRKYAILNAKILKHEGKFDNLLEKLHRHTGIKKRELKREIRTWNTDISDMYYS
ncbi:MAG TPA: hypothetical protein VKZ98_01155 [Aquaticitalea sp.]|nr:hypothetical protein [Aquaticitalea sp.]